ncbi:Aspartate beta-hydroxylase domain-containing protein 2 [Mactra antiquata]
MITFQEVHDLCVENSVSIAIVFLLLVWYINRKYGFNLMETEPPNTDTNYCDDENCVRCNKYQVTAKDALRLLSSIEDQSIALQIQKGIELAAKAPNLENSQKPNVFFYGQLLAVNIWDTEMKRKIPEDISLLETSYDMILEEYHNILKEGKSGLWKRNRTPEGSWDVFYLINQGVVIQENVDLVPNTKAVIDKLALIMKGNVFGNVMFSVLKPGTKITSHYGPTNIRLRCHLGLITTPQCSLTVNDDITTWEDGRCLVFDDSFCHSVDYTTETGHAEHTMENKHFNLCKDLLPERVVLIADLWHPDLTLEERQTINVCFHP